MLACFMQQNNNKLQHKISYNATLKPGQSHHTTVARLSPKTMSLLFDNRKHLSLIT
jgi:hypothetical protein